MGVFDEGSVPRGIDSKRLSATDRFVGSLGIGLGPTFSQPHPKQDVRNHGGRSSSSLAFSAQLGGKSLANANVMLPLGPGKGTTTSVSLGLLSSLSSAQAAALGGEAPSLPLQNRLLTSAATGGSGHLGDTPKLEPGDGRLRVRAGGLGLPSWASPDGRARAPTTATTATTLSTLKQPPVGLTGPPAGTAARMPLLGHGGAGGQLSGPSVLSSSLGTPNLAASALALQRKAPGAPGAGGAGSAFAVADHDDVAVSAVRPPRDKLGFAAIGGGSGGGEGDVAVRYGNFDIIFGPQLTFLPCFSAMCHPTARAVGCPLPVPTLIGR